MNLPKNTGLMELVPSEFHLSQNYPNPFSEKTTIKICVAYRTRVKLEVFNSEGELVRALLDEEKEAGTYGIEFSARGGSPPASNGRGCQAPFVGQAGAFGGDAYNLSDGIYVYQLQAGDFLATKKMLLLKHM